MLSTQYIPSMENLDINKLKEIQESNEEYSYSKLCDKINIPRVTGVQKICQLKNLGVFCNFEKNKTKYKILEVFKIDNIECNFLFKVDKKDSHSSGIYKIQKDNIVYIGQTSDFKNRFDQHNSLTFGKELGTYKLLHEGGTFEVLEFEKDRNKRLSIELKYIKKYSNNKNYICLNYIGTQRQSEFQQITNKTRVRKKKSKFIKVKEPKVKKQRKKYYNLKFNISDKDKIIKLLEENNINYKEI